MQKQVKIINFKATGLGVYKALELDFEKFKNGVIALKGQVGAGKSTIQNGIKTVTQGRETMADKDQYGENWESEIQLADGERKIFIGAKKTEGNTLDYVLFEKDDKGKRVLNPIVDGNKATPANYIKALTTEMTFGIKEFLDKNATVHRKFMFSLFKPELKKLGIETIEAELEVLTAERDKLRTQCTHIGAFLADFEREGWKAEQLAGLTVVNVETLTKQKETLLIERGTLAEKAKTDLEKKKGELEKLGAEINGKIRDLSEKLRGEYNLQVAKLEKQRSAAKDTILNACEMLKVEYLTQLEVHEGYVRDYEAFNNSCKIISSEFKRLNDNSLINESLLADWILFNDLLNKEVEGYEKRKGTPPIKPNLPTFEGTNIVGAQQADPRLKPTIDLYNSIPTNPPSPILPTFEGAKLKTKDYEDQRFTPLFDERARVGSEYMSLTETVSSTDEYDEKILSLENQIKGAENNNKLIDRYELNQEWLSAKNAVDVKRDELAAMYSQINTGVKGLKMSVFYNNEKPEIKTTYDGSYDTEFFKCENKDRLLVGYSQTQAAIIGVLLQVARLKNKAKVLPYIFLDDVPMSNNSTAVLARIAEENQLSVITSFTGDFTRENLKDNELLVQGGEVFFYE